ncbi:MAG: hypothetical protein AAGD06_28130 [Acidobacteriota bacterium]
MIRPIFRHSIARLAVCLMAFGLVAQPLWANPNFGSAAADPVQEAVSAFTTVTGDTADTYLALALLSDEYKALQTSLADSFGGSFRPTPEKAYAMTGGGNVGVFVPVAGGAGHSHFQIWLDAATNHVVASASALFDLHRDGTTRAVFGIDGRTVMDATLSEAGSFLSGWFIDAAGAEQSILEYAAERSFNCFLDCLSGFGIPNAILAAIAFGCGVLCGVTLGAGCVGCVFALGLGLGAEVGYCSGVC